MVHKTLLFANDPVALDMVAWEILESLRKKKRFKSLAADQRKPRHIITAAQHKLGLGERKQIELIKVNMS